MPSSFPVTATDPRLELMAGLCTPLYLFDAESVAVVWANDAALAFWCADSTEELYQRNMRSVASSTVKVRLMQLHSACFEEGRAMREQWTVYPKEHPKLTDFMITGFTSLQGEKFLLMQVLNSDSTHDGETAYRTTALMHTSTMISAYKANLELVYSNASARASMPERVSSATERIVSKDAVRAILEALKWNHQYDTELEVVTNEGIRWHALHVQRCTNPTSGEIMYLASEVDITEKHLAKQEAYRLAHTDALTGLSNRGALYTYLDTLHAQAKPAPFATLFLDLDRFKIINDSLGHAVGDQLLIEVARRLTEIIGTDGTAYRLGGDEFILITEVPISEARLTELADRILQVMGTSVKVEEHRLRVLPSIGIARYPEDTSRVDLMVDKADAAMYIAKTEQTGYCFYNEEMSSAISNSLRERLGLEGDMLTAIDDDEFELYFQPKISCETLTAKSVEGLLRWNHPRHGLIAPDKFICIAEETGQIVALGNWVLKAAMRQQKAWQDQGICIPVSVNISARQFSNNDLLSNVRDALQETGCKASMIELEITESILIGEPDAVFSTLQQLSSLGVRLALDDFGTGYSNLAYLQRYPLDYLKVDQIFLSDNSRSLLLSTILSMGKILGLKIVVEGVETAEQADWLIAHDCDLMQGYYFSHPQPAEQMTHYLTTHGESGADTSLAA